MKVALKKIVNFFCNDYYWNKLKIFYFLNLHLPPSYKVIVLTIKKLHRKKDRLSRAVRAFS